MHFIAFEGHMADTGDRNKLICEVARPQKKPGQVCFVAVLRAVHLSLCLLYNIAYLMQYSTKINQQLYAVIDCLLLNSVNHTSLDECFWIIWREYGKCLEFRNSENDVRKRETILLSQDVVVSGYSY